MIGRPSFPVTTDPAVIWREERCRRSPPHKRHHPMRCLLPAPVCIDDQSPLIKIVKKPIGNDAEILYYMDDLKASMSTIGAARTVHETVKQYESSVGMVINNKKSAIQLNSETPLPESLQDIPRMDEIPYQYFGFEMKKGEIEKKR